MWYTRYPTSVWLKYCSSSDNGGCIQSGLRALTKIFYKVEALVDDEGNVLIGDPEVKMPNLRVKLFLHLLGCMVCYALTIPDDGRAYIRRLCAIPVEVRALNFATYIYVLYQENHSERLQLSVGPVLP